MMDRLIAVLGVLMLVGWAASGSLYLWIRFRKPKTDLNHARLIAKPGATLDLVTEDGFVVAKVIMREISRDYRQGTTVEFVDYFRYIQERTYRS